MMLLGKLFRSKEGRSRMINKLRLSLVNSGNWEVAELEPMTVCLEFSGLYSPSRECVCVGGGSESP